MLWSKTFIPTMKETPEGAEIPSHVLMIRAGLIGQVMSGAYSYLPLGIRSLKKAQEIVRCEMDAAGAIEMIMPAMSPLSLWERTGRVEAFGNVLVQLTLTRNNRKVPVVLGPTHEEIVTEIVARHISSYRQLPITLYQIQNKFRNEERPRFGVLRTSEFLMKDAYSFNQSIESLGETYDAMYGAYCRIFERCGLEYLPVEAESGPIGGDASHEFMIPAENGEDSIVHCAECGYAANLEKAAIGAVDPVPSDVALKDIAKVATPGATTIDQVSGMLKCRPARMIKTLIYSADEKPIAVLIRGDHDANEGKIRRAVGAEKLQLADPDVIQRVTGAPVGFAGPVGMAEEIPIWADRDIQPMRNAVAGANAADTHLVGVNPDRDFQVRGFADLRNAGQDDACPRCCSKLDMRHAIEVGHVFKLGTKYSKALGARFLDDNEQQHDIIMGCYGIGINRIMAGLIEISHDDNGIIWPISLAPYEVLIVPLKVTDEETMKVSDQLVEGLTAAGVEVLVDDRDHRAGVKFKDADLIGIPLRIVLGPKGLKDSKVEIKWRWDDQPELIDLDSAAETIAEMVASERQDNARFKDRK